LSTLPAPTVAKSLAPPSRSIASATRHAGAACVILVIVGVLYRPLLWPWGHPVARITTDFTLQFYPWLYHSVGSLFSGRIPWWTELVGCGVPFVAALETGVFFPGHFLLGMVTAGQPSFFAAQVYQVMGVAVSGFGAYLLARELGAGWLGAVVAGGLWAASRDVAAHVIYVNFIDVLTCLPLLLLLGHRALYWRSPGALVGAALVLGVSLAAGDAQWTLMHVYALALLAVFWAAPTVARRGRWIWPLLAVAVIVAGGALLAMPTLLPAWEFLQLTSRSDYIAPRDATAVTAAWRFLVDDNPFGRGALFLLLAASAVVLRRERTILALGTLAVVALLLVVGDGGPLYPLAVKYLPGIGMFRIAGRFLHVAVFALALLAGLGLDRLWRREARVGWSGLIATALLVAVTAWWSGSAWTLAQSAGILLAAGLSAHVAWRRLVLLVLVASAVAFPAHGVHQKSSWVVQQDDFYRTNPLVSWLRAQPGLWRITNPGALITHAQARDYWDYHGLQFSGSYVTGIATWSSAGTLHVRALDTFAARATWYGRLYDLLNIRYLPQGLDPPPQPAGKYESWDLGPGSRWQFDLEGLAPLDGAVDLALRGRDLEVDVVRGGRRVTGTSREGTVRVADLAPGRLLTLVIRQGRGRVTSVRVGGREILGAAPRWHRVQDGLWENAHALPRAFVVGHYEVHPNRATLLEALPGLEPALSVALEEVPRFTPPGRPVQASGVDVVRYTAQEVEIVARLTEAGLLVLADTAYPGWRAEVDGQRVRLLRANYTFRAVALGPGEHRVTFRYRPWWRVWIWGLSAGGLVLALVSAPLICRRLPPLDSARDADG
jgi:hypothetical protein